MQRLEMGVPEVFQKQFLDQLMCQGATATVCEKDVPVLRNRQRARKPLSDIARLIEVLRIVC